MTLTWDSLQKRRQRWREQAERKRERLALKRFAQATPQAYCSSTPWTKDEHGNRSRQVGDVGNSRVNGPSETLWDVIG
jgi:hypothetical protein